VRSLVRRFLENQQTDETVIKGVLHLNVRNPLLRRVRDMGPQHPNFTALISILVANARMFAGQNLSAQDAIACFEQINTSLSRIAGLVPETVAGQTALTIDMLTSIGLHPQAAERLCATSETVEALLAAPIQQMAETASISPLLLATVYEELKGREPHKSANPSSNESTGTRIIAFKPDQSINETVTKQEED
jgi:hypothetical protein